MALLYMSPRRWLGPREAEVHLPSSGATVLYDSAGHMHLFNRANIE